MGGQGGDNMIVAEEIEVLWFALALIAVGTLAIIAGTMPEGW